MLPGARMLFSRRMEKLYDAEIEYLESTGTQFIDTGAIINYSDVAEAVASINNRGSIFGYINNSSIKQRFNVTGSGTISYAYYGQLTNSFGGTTTLYDTKYKFALGDGKFIIDETIVGTREYTDETLEGSLILFARRTNYTIHDYLVGKLYSFSVARNGVKILDQIPVRKGNVGYMYDRVSGKLFGNAGTGEFVLGPDIIDYTAKDYVQDGLIAMWDGIENAGWGVHDTSATTWKDLIGSNDALLSGALAPDRCWGNNHFYNNIESIVFTGMPSIAMKAAITSGQLTVQGLFMIDVKPSSGNMCIFQCSKASVTTDYMIFGVINRATCGSGNTISWATNRAINNFSPSGWEYIIGNTCALSFICDNATMTSILNGSSVQATRTNPLPVDSDLTSFAIFSYNWKGGNKRALRGKVYDLRLYSRALTDEEIAHNYAIDKARFGL